MKVTIKDIVKENREDLLVDKIVKSLLNDTEYRLYHRFMGEIVCEVKYPMFKGSPRIYDRVDIVEFLNMFKNEKDSELTSFRSSIDWNNYLESNYGMSGELNVSKIGIRYYNTLFTSILDEFDNFQYTPDYGPVNESVGNKEDLLIDRVVESLLGDTTYEVYHRFMGEIVCEVKFPMYREPMMYNRYEIKSHLNKFKEKGVEVIFFNLYDYNYMDDNYTIKDETILEKIYLKYYTILFTNILNAFYEYGSKPMNESVERKEETLNRIVDYMISDTKWDVHMEYEEDWEYVKVTMYWPGGDHEDYKTSDFEVVWEKFIMGDIDRKYLEQHFGITEEWIKQELYNRYIHKLRPIIYEEMINYFD